MGTCQSCGQWADNANHRCAGTTAGFTNGVDTNQQRVCLTKQEWKLAKHQAKSNIVQGSQFNQGDTNHSAKYYKLKAKEAKLQCKMAKAEAGCRC